MNIDDRIDEERIRQFASQLEHLSDSTISDLKGAFRGNQGKEFYEGLLSGYASIYALSNQLPAKKFLEYLGPLVAFTARELQKKQRE